MINKFSDVPLYSQLKQMIAEKIENGEYPPDSKIPSEQEFCEEFEISRPTVRQAINELTNNGLLYRMKGKGTFVTKLKSVIEIKNYNGFTDSILDSQVPGDREFIRTGVVSNKKLKFLNEIFNIVSGQGLENEFAELIFTSKANGEVISLNKSYIPLSLFPNILQDVKNKKPSYDILMGKYPLLPSRSKSTLDLTYSDQTDAQYLKMQIGQPVIRIENVLSSKSSQVVEYVISKYKAGKCRLMFEHNK
ncbi:MAG: GntR family transcriptional regulator [Eubacteriales bacterium]|nr:GntR family transcriptional regulator [Eubacteriales bacterium]